MKTFILTFFIFCYSLFPQNIQKKEIGNLVLENIPDIEISISKKMNQFQNIRSASFSSWDPIKMWC